MGTEVESYEFAVLVDGEPVEWFKSFYSEGGERAKAIAMAEQLRAEGKDVSVERTITFCAERDIIWGADAIDDEE